MSTSTTEQLLKSKKPEPIDWPTNVTYLRRPTHSPNIPPDLLSTLNKPTKATSSFHKLGIADIPTPNPSVQISQVVPATHPAYPDSGLYATKHLPPSSLIIPYIGHIHLNTPEDTDPSSSYDISLDREIGAGISIDAASAGNEARFVNDYRGVAERPNAEFKDLWVRVGEKQWERWLGVFVLGAGKAGLRKAGIRRGEEILVSYGKGFWVERRRGGESVMGNENEGRDAEGGNEEEVEEAEDESDG